MNSEKQLNSLVFIKLPENFELKTKEFSIDPAILLPVQKKVGEEDKELNLSELTEEQILSGILTVLAYDSTNENSEYYRKLITDVRPNIKKELAEAAILKTGNEDWELAEEIWMAVKGIDPNDKNVILNMAIFFDQKADNFQKLALYDDEDAYNDLAKHYYTEAMDSNPEIPDAYFNAAFFYLKKHLFRDAKACFESFLALVVDIDDEELGENGIYKKERAQELIDKISNRNLDNEKFHNAYVLISSGQEEKGLEEIRKFIRDNPAVWNAWFLLGWGLRRMGRFEEAKQSFLKARECEGGDENADTLNELAICQMETGEIENAKETLIEALQYDPDNTKVISNLGYLCLKTGDKEEAKKYFLTVLEIDPEDKIAKDQVSRL